MTMRMRMTWLKMVVDETSADRENENEQTNEENEGALDEMDMMEEAGVTDDDDEDEEDMAEDGDGDTDANMDVDDEAVGALVGATGVAADDAEEEEVPVRHSLLSAEGKQDEDEDE